jgi:hypothetical protein
VFDYFVMLQEWEVCTDYKQTNSVILNIGKYLETTSNHNCRQVSIFTGDYIPDMDIQHYCERLYRYLKCSTSSFVLGTVYLNKYIKASKITVNPLSVHSLTLVSLLISSKYIEDELFSNNFFSQVGGLDCTMVNQLEIHMLSTLDYNLWVDKTQFDWYAVKFGYTQNPEINTNKNWRGLGLIMPRNLGKS